MPRPSPTSRAARARRSVLGYLVAGAAPPPRRGNAAVHRHVLRQHPGQRARRPHRGPRLRRANRSGAGGVDRRRTSRSRTRWSIGSRRSRPTRPAPSVERASSASRTAGRCTPSRSSSGFSRTPSRWAGRRSRTSVSSSSSDVLPYELMKLRLLNASHQAMSYLGILSGATYVHEVCTDPLFTGFLRGYMHRRGDPDPAPRPRDRPRRILRAADRPLRQRGHPRHPRAAGRGRIRPNPQVPAPRHPRAARRRSRHRSRGARAGRVERVPRGTHRERAMPRPSSIAGSMICARPSQPRQPPPAPSSITHPSSATSAPTSACAPRTSRRAPRSEPTVRARRSPRCGTAEGR